MTAHPGRTAPLLPLQKSYPALVRHLVRLVGRLDSETGGHLVRLGRYTRVLAEEAAAVPLHAGEVARFFRVLPAAAVLHDVGKLAVPVQLLQKPGALDARERRVMQAHTVLGARLLETLMSAGDQLFVETAVAVARHHHERWDGRGYPHGLAGEAIPLPARLVALADVYDALRSRRSYKPALPHAVAVRTIVEDSPGQFDPGLVQVFERCAPRIERIFREP